MNLEKYQNNEVLCFYSKEAKLTNGKCGVGIVANIDEDIGLTIVSKNNVKEELVCVYGPSSPMYEEMPCADETYNSTLKMINNGYVDYSVIEDIISRNYSGPGVMGQCQFNL